MGTGRQEQERWKARRVGPIVAWAIALTIAGLSNGPAMSQDKTTFTDAQKSEIQEMVRDYILQNPGIIVEAFGILEAREQAAQQQRLAQVMAEYAEDIERDPKDPVMGNPDGDVTIVEFFDYQCGYCKSMLKPLLAFAAEDGNVRVVIKEFPILGPASVIAAQASLASAKQDKYDAFHQALMGLRGRLDEAAIFQTAVEVGIDVDQLRADMQSPAIQFQIDKTQQLAQVLGVRGTPAFIIGGRLIPGAFGPEQLRQYVADTRADG